MSSLFILRSEGHIPPKRVHAAACSSELQLIEAGIKISYVRVAIWQRSNYSKFHLNYFRVTVKF